MNPKVLLVDDEPNMLEAITTLLQDEGFTIRCASDGMEAAEIFENEAFQVVVTDVRMPGKGGFELVRELKQKDQNVEIILFTAYASIEEALSAIRDYGASDYLLKPIKRADELILAIRKAIERRNLRLENHRLLEELKQANEELERKIDERTEHLAQANAELAVLYTIAATVNGSLDRKNMLTEVAECICRVLNVPRSAFIMFDEDRTSGLVEAGFDTLDIPGRGIGEKLSISGQPLIQAVLDTRLPVIVEDAAVDPRTEYLKKLVERYELKSVAFVPLIHRGLILGVMVLDRLCKDPAFNPREIELLKTVAEQISVGLKNISLYDQTKDQLQSLEEKERALRGYATELEDKVRERVAEARRLELLSSLGEMSAAVAHEIRNPLAGVSSNAQLLRDSLGQPEDPSFYKELTDNILIGVRRIEKIIRDFLDFAKPKPSLRSKSSLKEIVLQTTRLISPQCKQKKINLEFDLAEGLPLLDMDRIQIQQVLINILQNAIQATSEGGKISLGLRSSARASSPEPVSVGGRCVSLSISDTGCGIKPEILHRIFDPFFTTKLNGTGLGLSISSLILEEHGVGVEVESKPGAGTTFILFFPLFSEKRVKGGK